MNCDGVSDLLIGAFLVPGLYIIAGDDGSSGDNSSPVILAIVSGVLGCLFCVGRELRILVSMRFFFIQDVCCLFPPRFASQIKTLTARQMPSEVGRIVFWFNILR